MGEHESFEFATVESRVRDLCLGPDLKNTSSMSIRSSVPKSYQRVLTFVLRRKTRRNSQ